MDELELGFFSKEQITVFYLDSILPDFGALEVLFPLRKKQKKQKPRYSYKKTNLRS